MHSSLFFQVRRGEQEADLRPITPSKIPVGAWRAEEEKAINRALNGPIGSMDSNRQSSERAISPAPPSRIPKFSFKLGANYRAVQVSYFPVLTNLFAKKELSFFHKLKFSNIYIFATKWYKPLNFKPQKVVMHQLLNMFYLFRKPQYLKIL